jgi:hypothetical protein
MMCNIKTRSVPVTVRSGSLYSALLLAGAMLLGPGGGGQRCAAQFPAAPAGGGGAGGYQADEGPVFSIGVFQIQVQPSFAALFAPATGYTYYYPGFSPSSDLLTSPVMFDEATEIGSSGLDTYPWLFNFPETIGQSLFAYPPGNMIAGAGDYYAIPFAFEFGTGPDRIYTEIEHFDLSCSSSQFSCSSDVRVPGAAMNLDMVTAGPLSMGNVAWAGHTGSMSTMFDPTLPANLPQRSIGMVQQMSLIAGAAASSFFDINVQVNLPAVTGTVTASAFPTIVGGAFNGLQLAQLTNSPTQPLIIVNTNVTTLPPGVVYIHGQTPAVPLYFLANNLPYWTSGELFGYVTLAGHGVLPTFTCSNSTGGGQETNCCVELAGTGAVTTLLNTTLGLVGSPNPGMMVPWKRTNGFFPTASTTLTSVSNVVVDSLTGNTNDLSATTSFTFGSTVIPISRLTLGPLSNSIAPPPANSTATFNAPNVPLSFQLAVNGTAYQASGTASMTIIISNTGSASATLYYGTNAQSQTYYSLQMTAFSGSGTWPGGPFYLQQNPSNASLGNFILGQAAGGGYTAGTQINANFQASTDHVNYFNASNPLQLVPGIPAPAPTYIAGLVSGTNVVLNWLGSFTLQTTTNLLSPWINVSAGPISGPYTNNHASREQFFRLAGP